MYVRHHGQTSIREGPSSLLKNALQLLTEGNFGLLVSSGEIVHPLTLVGGFPVEIPIDFTLEGCTRGNSKIQTANFPRSALKRGKRYLAGIYRLESRLDSQAIVEVANQNNLLCGGALGGAVLCNNYATCLPRDSWVACIDKKQNFTRQKIPDGLIEVPIIGPYGPFGLTWSLGFRLWKGYWDAGGCVAFFKEL